MIKLNVPYHSQMNNWFNPTGACNVTSMVMAMRYAGYKFEEAEKKGMQPEDWLYRRMEREKKSRHSPYDLALACEEVSGGEVYDNFAVDATHDQLKAHLNANRIAVIHGYFTDFGHIIAVVGYDEEKGDYICHDPYGEWYATGYHRNCPRNQARGEFVRYSYGLIDKLCRPDGNFWVHFISADEPSPYLPLSDEDKARLSGYRLNDVIDLELKLDFKPGAKIQSSLVLNVQIAVEEHFGVEAGPRDGVLGKMTAKAFREVIEPFQDQGCDPETLSPPEATLLIQGRP